MTIVYPDFLYVGTKAAAADRDVLEQFSITHIVNGSSFEIRLWTFSNGKDESLWRNIYVL